MSWQSTRPPWSQVVQSRTATFSKMHSVGGILVIRASLSAVLEICSFEQTVSYCFPETKRWFFAPESPNLRVVKIVARWVAQLGREDIKMHIKLPAVVFVPPLLKS